MSIEKINFSYPRGTLQSVYDTEEMTALELAAKTSKKVDECIDMVNGVEQTAIDATAIVDEMRIAQDQFMIDNIDYIRQDVNTKVDALISDGTLENLINDTLLGEVNGRISTTERAFYEVTGDGVINGLEVLAQASPDMSVLISAGVAHLYNGKRYALLENATATIDAPDPLYPRIDIIYINSSGVLTYGKGEATSSPIAPTPVNGLMLAEIYVDKTDTVITTSMITDKRKRKVNVEGLKSIVDTHASQLAQITRNLKTDYNAVGDGVANDTTALQEGLNALEQGMTLTIPNGVYNYDTNIVISNKTGFKLIVDGELFDKCKVVTTTLGEDKIPVGITFNNCKDFEIIGLTNNSDVEQSAEMLSINENQRVPHVDFVDCSNFKITKAKAKGIVGAYVYNLSQGIEHFMRSSFYRFVGCRGVDLIEPEIVSGAGIGEFYSFVNCENLNIIRPTHYQGAASITFWSMGKIINCKNVIIDDVRLQGESSGSLFDVAGTNITLRNSNVDYPKSKMLDITLEWGPFGGDSYDILIDSCTTNGTLCANVVNDQGTGVVNQKVDNVRIKNSYSTRNVVEGERSGLIQLGTTKSSYIEGVKFHNIRDIIRHTPTTFTAFDRTYHLNNIEITSDVELESRLCHFDVYGEVLIENGKINLDQINSLRLYDRKASYENLDDLSQSDSLVHFKNVNFKNTKIDIQCNVLFENCSFTNCCFVGSTIEPFIKPKVRFIRSSIKVVEINSIIKNGELFSIGTIGTRIGASLIEFIDTKVHGNLLNASGNALFNIETVCGTEIVIRNSIFALNRMVNGNPYPQKYFSLSGASKGSADISYSKFDNVFLIELWEESTFISDSYTMKMNSITLNEGTQVGVAGTNIPAVNNKLKINVSMSKFDAPYFTTLSNKSAEFGEWKQGGNVEI